MSALKLIAICTLVAGIPMGVVAAMNYDSFMERMTVDPATAQGKILYFMAPSR